MAITLADFTKIWASTSPLTPYSFSDPNYAEGWNFIGGTPPSRQMWDSIQNFNDSKMKYIVDNFLPLTGGSITGNLDVSGTVTAGVGLPPVGSVTAFAGSTTPQGWLLCDGSAVSRTDYADLYAVIGDTYGAGDGSTTFNLPNLVDKFVEGSATSGTEKTAGLPNITGSGLNVQSSDTSAVQGLWVRGGNGALYAGGGWARTGTLTGYAAHETYTSEICVDASRSNAIYGNSTTVQPPALTMRYIIKY